MWKSYWNRVCRLFIIMGAASLVAILLASADGSGSIDPDPDWTTEVADATTCVGVDSQIALDSDGNPHIVHYDSTNTALRHSYLENSVWQNEIVDSSGDCGEEPGVAVDSEGRVHVAYLGGDECRYAKKVFGTWTLQVIETVSSGRAGATSIALDSDGNPHVSYVHSSGDDPDNPVILVSDHIIII